MFGEAAGWADVFVGMFLVGRLLVGRLLVGKYQVGIFFGTISVWQYGGHLPHLV